MFRFPHSFSYDRFPSVRQWEFQHAFNPYESGLLVDATGKPINYYHGDTHTIKGSGKAIYHTNNEIKNDSGVPLALLTHNHPSGVPLSSPDILTGAINDIAVRAVMPPVGKRSSILVHEFNPGVYTRENAEPLQELFNPILEKEQTGRYWKENGSNTYFDSQSRYQDMSKAISQLQDLYDNTPGRALINPKKQSPVGLNRPYQRIVELKNHNSDRLVGETIDPIDIITKKQARLNLINDYLRDSEQQDRYNNFSIEFDNGFFTDDGRFLYY